MSEKNNLAIILTEKICGILAIIISGIMLYYTTTTKALGTFNGMFVTLWVVALIAGIFNRVRFMNFV